MTDKILWWEKPNSIYTHAVLVDKTIPMTAMPEDVNYDSVSEFIKEANGTIYVESNDSNYAYIPDFQIKIIFVFFDSDENILEVERLYQSSEFSLTNGKISAYLNFSEIFLDISQARR